MPHPLAPTVPRGSVPQEVGPLARGMAARFNRMLNEAGALGSRRGRPAGRRAAGKDIGGITMAMTDEYRGRLERAGWSVREVSRDAPAGTAWGVVADREGERVWGFGPTPADAWRDACRQAEALGLLAPG